jgi:hypothetical protein
MKHFSLEKRLEAYTLKRPQEVLLVTVEIQGEPEQIIVFKGFSSSLMRPTAFDPDVAILPEQTTLIRIDRVASPYNPTQPTYIQAGLNWEMMEQLLQELDL